MGMFVIEVTVQMIVEAEDKSEAIQMLNDSIAYDNIGECAVDEADIGVIKHWMGEAREATLEEAGLMEGGQ
jgi:hypothetical protein